MRVVVGIDLGSTTSKAVVLDEHRRILGRGITNSRSNYELAAEVARTEAFTNARFTLLQRGAAGKVPAAWLERLERAFRLEQRLVQAERLRTLLHEEIERGTAADLKPPLHRAVDTLLDRFEAEERERYEASRRDARSDFFRDLVGAAYNRIAEEIADPRGASFDRLLNLYDKCIIQVENEPLRLGFGDLIHRALARLDAPDTLAALVTEVTELALETAASVGTGYGRQRLPFPKEQIRSEILCHGLGAHAMFPGTRTVLDIGGQDTKAIQVDEHGIVTNFQMNDRCAAGCGRYLGYIADEMNLGLHELGPLALQSRRPVRINSTCTVFAGAELRERLSLGERREDILAGLHRAIVLRAMGLLARSGGVHDEFTFTGGVAKNVAAVAALKELIFRNYGELTVNISPDSIYTGALGAALFAHRIAESCSTQPAST